MLEADEGETATLGALPWHLPSLPRPPRRSALAQPAGMVLLQLTPALRTRLDALAPRLPLELRDRVASHLAPHGDDEAIQGPERTNNEPKQPLAIADRVAETIPHQVLVDVSSWARGADVADRGTRALDLLDSLLLSAELTNSETAQMTSDSRACCV